CCAAATSSGPSRYALSITPSKDPADHPGRVCLMSHGRPASQCSRPAHRNNLVDIDTFDLRATDQLDVRHRRVVAGTEAALEDTQVAAGTLLVAWSEFDEQLTYRFLVTQAREGKSAIGDAVGLGERDQRLGHPTKFLRL